MLTLKDRERAFENKYAHDAEMLFKAQARRNRLVGLWAADLMGLEGDAATDYAKQVVKADFEEHGTEAVVRKLVGDLGDKADEQTVRDKMEEQLTVAKAQIVEES
ncbi:hypothetical protein SAMN04490244_101326 [Tranquillimonas rosea]|uniref:Aldolase n=1 Tax=Tranquillimonas rosea TaxID=641238 RepID=A0A1H9PUG8_9RHOB|nr:DUF1476 domain-containing protein [Tranquillimonas rosea]SER51485.1 hypothetical protein SAMN04490244_101326 [Tranquillimonas rosea]